MIRLFPAPVTNVKTKITNTGSSNFVVYGYGAAGTDQLVNVTGNFTGEVLFLRGTAFIQIQSDGAWSILPL